MWQMIAGLLASKAQQAADEAKQRQQVGAQMKADYASSLTGGPQSYHAPPPPANSTDLSSLFSLMNPAKAGGAATALTPAAAAGGSSSFMRDNPYGSPGASSLSPEIIDPWAQRKQGMGY